MLHKAHILCGQFPFGSRQVQTVQCAQVVTRNMASCNAIVHVIDRVSMQPQLSVSFLHRVKMPPQLCLFLE